MFSFFLGFHRRTSIRWDDARHPYRSLGVWVAIDFPLTPPSLPSSPSGCYWRRIFTKSSESLTSTRRERETMAEMDEVRAVRPRGANRTHISIKCVSLYVRVHDTCLCLLCVREISMTMSIRQELRERAGGFCRDAVVPAHFLDDCSTVISLTVSTIARFLRNIL